MLFSLVLTRNSGNNHDNKNLDLNFLRFRHVAYLHKSNHLKGINGWCGYLQEYEKCEALLTQVRLIYDKNYNYIKSKQIDLKDFIQFND